MFKLIPLQFFNGNNSVATSLYNFVENFFGDIFTEDLKLNDIFKAVVKETDDAYIVLADVHGINRSDIKVGYKNNYFTISIIKRGRVEQSSTNFKIIKGGCGKISRSFYINNINVKMMKVGFKKDVLIIRLPKRIEIADVKDRVLIK